MREECGVFSFVFKSFLLMCETTGFMEEAISNKFPLIFCCYPQPVLILVVLIDFCSYFISTHRLIDIAAE